jgi:hypothetical protein
MQEKDLIITSVIEAAGACATYDEYSQKVKTCNESVNYWGLGIFGDAATINKYTTGLKLYAKQPQLPNADTLPPKRLIGEKSGLPMFRFVLANNLSGGELANTATILGVTYGKLFSDSIFGPDITDYAGESLGLPMIDLAILNGHATKNESMRKLRDELHKESKLSVVDVTDATGKTRSYPDYLNLAENTPVLETTYWGVGIAGPSELVDKYTADLSSYITSAEEQALIKKQAAAKKWESKKPASAVQKVSTEKSEKSTFNEAAGKENLRWQQQRSLNPVINSTSVVSHDDETNNASEGMKSNV